MNYITLNGVRYAIHQQGAGDPLLILHGFTGDGASFMMRLTPLAETHQLIAPDLLGHGQTASPPDPQRYAMRHAIADLQALLDQLGINRCAVLGYSMGGRLALGFAVSHPERVSALVLESASAGLATQTEREARIHQDEALAERIVSDGIEKFVAEWERLPLWRWQSASLKAELRAQRLRNQPMGLANSLRGMGTGAQPYLGDRLARLTMPVLIITGEQDAKFTQIGQEMGRSIPHANQRIIAGAGHAVHLEAPAAYWDAVRAFLSTIAGDDQQNTNHHEG